MATAVALPYKGRCHLRAAQHSSTDKFNREIVILIFVPEVHILPPQTLDYEFETLVGYLKITIY